MVVTTTTKTLGYVFGTTSGTLQNPDGSTVAAIFDASTASPGNVLRLSGSGSFGGGEPGTKFTLYASFNKAGAGALQVPVFIQYQSGGGFSFTMNVPMASYADGSTSTVNVGSTSQVYLNGGNLETGNGSFYYVDFTYEIDTPATDQDIRLFNVVCEYL